MHSRIAALALVVVMTIAPTAFAGGKKEAKASISFHMESDPTDNPKMVAQQHLPNGKVRGFRRMPEFTMKDVATFNPFPAEIGGGYGMVLKLKSNAASRLSAISNANQGKQMIAVVNGRMVDEVQLDKQIDDGILVIWQGVTLADITLLDGELPRAGAEGKKKK